MISSGEGAMIRRTRLSPPLSQWPEAQSRQLQQTTPIWGVQSPAAFYSFIYSVRSQVQIVVLPIRKVA